MKDTQLAVVIPLFNKQNSIRRAVNSVLGQSYQNLELIIVNDGSTDASLENLKTVDDDRIKIINQENKGVSVARNRGVATAASNYVCFLDADDEWLPSFLAEINKLIQQNPDCSLYGSAYKHVDENGITMSGSSSLADGFYGVVDNFYQHYKVSNNLIHSSSACINKKYFTKIGGFPETVKYGEDIYLWLALANIGDVSISNKKSAIVHRDAENRAGDSIDNEVGYHVKYFLGDGIGSIKEMHRKDLISFVKRSALYHALYATIIGKRRLAREYAGYIYKQDRMMGVFTWLATCLPKSFLSLARKIRNS